MCGRVELGLWTSVGVRVGVWYFFSPLRSIHYEGVSPSLPPGGTTTRQILFLKINTFGKFLHNASPYSFSAFLDFFLLAC